MEKLRILIVDDHPLFRQGVRHTLEATKDIEVIGEAPDGQRAIQMAETLAPDIMLVDINLPGLNGLEVTRVVDGASRRSPASSSPYTRTTSSYSTPPESARRPMRPKTSRPTICSTWCARWARGTTRSTTTSCRARWSPQDAQPVPRTGLPRRRAAKSVFAPLTTREVEILDCIARGNSNKEIARILNICDQTVKNHITSILRKLAVNDRTQAVIYALRHGWIKMSDE